MTRNARCRHWFLATTFIVFASRMSAHGALDLSSISHTEDFDFLSSFSSPVTWVDDKGSPEDEMGSPGWYWQSSSSTYTVDFGESPGNGLYSYGGIGEDDRAMGSINAGSNSQTVWGLVLRNVLSDVILQLDISYTGEKWRDASALSDSITFSYMISSTEIDDFDGSVALPGGWTSVSALDFTSTNPFPGTPVALDGNHPDNRTALSASIQVTIPVGHYIALRWYGADVGGVDDGLAIDDLIITAAVPEPTAATYAGVICGFIVLLVVGRRFIRNVIATHFATPR